MQGTLTKEPRPQGLVRQRKQYLRERLHCNRAGAQTPWSAAPVLRLPPTPTLPAQEPDLNHSAISIHSDWQLLCPAPCNLLLVHLFISQYSSFSCIFRLSLPAKFLLLMMLQCKARKGQPQLSAGQGLPSLLCLAFVARVVLSAPWTRCQRKQSHSFNSTS